MGGLRTRLLRYQRPIHRVHWHIDYLLQSKSATLREIWVWPTTQRIECAKNALIVNLAGASIPIPGFGSSDCHARCAAHLVYFEEYPSLENLTGIIHW